MDEITVTLTREQQCDHEWKEPLDSMCERDVYCVKCGVRLERYEETGEVYWPCS